jgi:hypothetical protein
MLSLQSKLYQIGVKLAGITTKCFHYWRPVKDVPCLMWAENGEADSFEADNHKQEQTISGTCDFYTKTEFDPLIDAVQEALDEMELAWALNSVQYEDDTQMIHYEWTWEVVVRGEVPGGAGN